MYILKGTVLTLADRKWTQLADGQTLCCVIRSQVRAFFGVWFLCKPASVLMANLGGNGKGRRKKSRVSERGKGEIATRDPLQTFCSQFQRSHPQTHNPSTSYPLSGFFRRTEPFVKVMEEAINNPDSTYDSTIFLEFVSSKTAFSVFSD